MLIQDIVKKTPLIIMSPSEGTYFEKVSLFNPFIYSCVAVPRYLYAQYYYHYSVMAPVLCNNHIAGAALA